MRIVLSFNYTFKRNIVRTTNRFWSLTCENRFVRLKFPSADSERYIAKFLVLKQQPEIVGQPALRYFKLYRITLPGDVYTVRHYADLWRYNGVRGARPADELCASNKIE